MRSLEVVIAAGAIFAVGWPVVFGVRPKRGIVAGSLSIAIVAQLQFEGYRWQMIPLYLTAAGLAVGDVFFLDRDLKWSNRVSRGIFGLMGVALTLIPPLALPVPELPIPSGPQAVGTTSVEFIATVDQEVREETYGPEPGTPRRLIAQVWYPAVPVPDAEQVRWSEDWDVVAPAMSRELGFPSWFLDYTRYTFSNARLDAPVAAGAFPVIIYSHGWTGFRTIAVNQAETLASNGYIVIAVDHTYGSVAARFEDGTVAFHDPAALPDAEVVGGDAYAEAAEELVETFADDIISVLDELDLGDQGAFSEIAPSADLTRIGIYGHSTGGGAAMSVCLTDERCDAVLGMDPWVEPIPDSILKIDATTPAMFMRSDEWRGNENDSTLLGIAGRNNEISYVVGIEGANHNDFVVAPLLSPVAGTFGIKGPIPSGRIITILDNYLLGFFDVYLLGTGSAALDAVGFEEVSIEVVNR